MTQAPGKGAMMHLEEPRMHAGYWLYLPEGYPTASKSASPEPGRKWPLVVSFHGMKPWDDSKGQIREWQQEADRYGFIVCAPDLATCNSFSEYPIRHVVRSLQRDEAATINILDEIARTTDVDPNAVLSTSWSMGGYIAHYMANRHPDRFSCIAVRQSNFAAEILDPANVPLYRDHKVAIYWTQNDFAACKRESQDGARWYNQQGFDVTFAEFAARGHDRIPSPAASFFARTCGATPKSPPLELAALQVKEMPLTHAVQEPAVAANPPAANSAPTTPAAAPSPIGAGPTSKDSRPADLALSAKVRPSVRPTAPPVKGEILFQPTAVASDGTVIQNRPVPNKATGKTAPPRSASFGDHPPTAAAEPAVTVRVNTLIGISPLLVSFSAEMPESWRRDASCLWTDNGEPVGNGLIGQKYLTASGDHHIEVLATLADGREFRAAQTVTVIERMPTKR